MDTLPSMSRSAGEGFLLPVSHMRRLLQRGVLNVHHRRGGEGNFKSNMSCNPRNGKTGELCKDFDHLSFWGPAG